MSVNDTCSLLDFQLKILFVFKLGHHGCKPSNLNRRIKIAKGNNMYVINRSAAIIIPKQPFVDWANSLEEKENKYSIKDFNSDCTVILLPEIDSDEHAVKDLYKNIFEAELSSWTTDENEWPRNRKYEMFLEWFEFEYHSIALDPFEDDIEKEPYVY